MTSEPTYTVTREQLVRASERMRSVMRYARRAAGLSETPLRTRAVDLIERRLQDGGLAQRYFNEVFVNERFPRLPQPLMKKRIQQLRQEEEPPEKKTEPRKEPEEELKFDFSPIFY